MRANLLADEDWEVCQDRRTKKRIKKRKVKFCNGYMSNQASTARDGRVTTDARQVNSLIEVRDESTRTIQYAEVWEEVEMIVDSGASGTVVGENMVNAVEAENVQKDISFKLADGSRTPHMGEKAFNAYTDQGHLRHMVAAVTEVDDALLSVSKVVKAGNRVVFDADGSYIEHKTNGRSNLTD